MSVFVSRNSYDEFARSVKHSSRYGLDDEARQFLAAVVAISASKRQFLSAHGRLWRAQRGHAWTRIDEHSDSEIPGPHEAARMTPLPYSAKEGRVNLKGIPCSYLNDDRNTAVSEVRPWLGEAISVAQFRASEPLALVDC